MEVIKISNISKNYRLGKISSGRLSEDINSFILKLFGKKDPSEILIKKKPRNAAFY